LHCFQNGGTTIAFLGLLHHLSFEDLADIPEREQPAALQIDTVRRCNFLCFVFLDQERD
jgi:hypothetical protein